MGGGGGVQAAGSAGALPGYERLNLQLAGLHPTSTCTDSVHSVHTPPHQHLSSYQISSLTFIAQEHHCGRYRKVATLSLLQPFKTTTYLISVPS